jgi:hypothetical protein
MVPAEVLFTIFTVAAGKEPLEPPKAITLLRINALSQQKRKEPSPEAVALQPVD